MINMRGPSRRGVACFELAFATDFGDDLGSNWKSIGSRTDAFSLINYCRATKDPLVSDICLDRGSDSTISTCLRPNSNAVQ